MPNEHDKDGMIHQWIYVIIPVSKGKQLGYSTEDLTYPLFCAFCKACRKYFTEPIGYQDYYSSDTGGRISNSSLPKYGCIPPDDIPAI